MPATRSAFTNSTSKRRRRAGSHTTVTARAGRAITRPVCGRASRTIVSAVAVIQGPSVDQRGVMIDHLVERIAIGQRRAARDQVLAQRVIVERATNGGRKGVS